MKKYTITLYAKKKKYCQLNFGMLSVRCIFFTVIKT